MIKRLSEHLAVLVLTFWIGAMWTVAYVVAPTLFSTIADRGLAGNVAGRMFSLVAWIGIGCASYLLIFLTARRGWDVLRSGVFWLLLVMLACILVGQFGVQPLMAELKANAWPREVMSSAVRDRFATLHGVSSVLYLVQSILGLFLVLGFRRVLR